MFLVEYQHSSKTEPFYFTSNHHWVHRTIGELKLKPNQLLVLVRKATGGSVVPKGETWIEHQGVVVLVKR